MTDGEALLIIALLFFFGFIPFYLIGVALSFIGLLRKYLKRKIYLTELEIQSLSAEMENYRFDEE